MKKFYFYLARCKDKTLYAGYTKNIKLREEKHNLGKGAKYTRQRRPIEIVYFEEFDTQRDAMQREAQVKRWAKDKKEKLINNKL